VHSWPYLIVLVLLGGMLYLSTRNRKRQAAAEAARVEQIGVGTEVMTTSGLYGTVVAKDDDGTVLLSVARGVELKWALAALRPVAELPTAYRRGIYDTPGASDSVDETRPDGGEPGPGAAR
jgi:preprotein translocase subunit YajC